MMENNIKQWQKELPTWQHFHNSLHHLLVAILDDKSPCIYSVLSRVKTIESIHHKLKLIGSHNLSDISDIVGFKIVVPTRENVGKIFNLLKSEFEIIEAEAKIEIEGEKEDYESVHLIITLNKARRALSEWKPFTSYIAEIQIVTLVGQAWQLAAHALHYKSVQEASTSLRGKNVVEQLNSQLSEFETLLSKPDVHEKRDIHPFIAKHTFILHPSPSEFFSETSIGVGTEYRIDFMIREADGSYLLVEIENPKHPLFTKSGEFTAALNHAQRQVEDWQEWIEDNLPTVQKKFPDISAPRGLVIIGRIETLTSSERRRLDRRNTNLRGRLMLWTYDHLINNTRNFIDTIKKNIDLNDA